MARGESVHRILLDLWYLKFLFQECNSYCPDSPGRSVVVPVQRGIWLSLSPRTQTMSMFMDVYHCFSRIFPVNIVRLRVCNLFVKGFSA